MFICLFISLNNLRAGSALSHKRTKRSGGEESGEDSRTLSRLAASPLDSGNRATSFPGSLILPPRRKMRDPGNEVGNREPLSGSSLSFNLLFIL